MDVELMKQELTRDEGLKLKPYRCTAGKLSIGVGRNLDDVGISMAEASELLGNDIDRTAKALDASIVWWRSLDEVRQRVVLNMAYNLGTNGLLGFKNTLKAIQTGDYEVAAEDMLESKWAGQVGDRARRLADMMRTGVA